MTTRKILLLFAHSLLFSSPFAFPSLHLPLCSSSFLFPPPASPSRRPHPLILLGCLEVRSKQWHSQVLVGPQLKQKIGVCQNEHRPRYRVQKYVTAIHRRKLVKNCGCGSGAPEKFFDVVLRNVELLCILDSGVGRQYSNCNQDFHDIGTSVPYIGPIQVIFRGVKNYGPGDQGPLNAGGSCALHNLLLRYWQ